MFQRTKLETSCARCHVDADDPKYMYYLPPPSDPDVRTWRQPPRLICMDDLIPSHALERKKLTMANYGHSEFKELVQYILCRSDRTSIG